MKYYPLILSRLYQLRNEKYTMYSGEMHEMFCFLFFVLAARFLNM